MRLWPCFLKIDRYVVGRYVIMVCDNGIPLPSALNVYRMSQRLVFWTSNLMIVDFLIGGEYAVMFSFSLRKPFVADHVNVLYFLKIANEMRRMQLGDFKLYAWWRPRVEIYSIVLFMTEKTRFTCMSLRLNSVNNIIIIMLTVALELFFSLEGGGSPDQRRRHGLSWVGSDPWPQILPTPIFFSPRFISHLML